MKRINTGTFSTIFYSILVVLLIGPKVANSQYIELEAARQLAVAKKHADAELMLQALLKTHPDFVPAQIMQGHNFAWWENYDAAIATYEDILKNDSANTEALNGLGYAHSWSGNTGLAEDYFFNALQLDPNNENARKGLGYNYLAADNETAAQTIFRALLNDFPGRPEYLIGLGQAYLLENKTRQAADVFKRALAIDPTNDVAQSFLQYANTKAPFLEADIWSGWTRIDDEETFGIRQVQLSYRFHKKITGYLRYDNALSLDNVDFIVNSREAASFVAGSLVGWNKQLASRLEYGLRFVPESETQHLLQAEQVFYLPGMINLKVGGFTAFSNSSLSEWYTFAGAYLPLNEWLALEPTYFYSRNESISDDQHRWIVAGKLRLASGFEWKIGGFYGTANLASGEDSKRLSGGYSLVVLPVHKNLWLLLSANYEDGVLNRTTVVAGGLKWRFHK